MSIASCDAYLRLPYKVKNCTKETISLEVKDFFNETTPGVISDTIIKLEPNETKTIATAIGIGFPWETKKLFNANPGVQNFRLMDSMEIDNSDENWSYKKKFDI